MLLPSRSHQSLHTSPHLRSPLLHFASPRLAALDSARLSPTAMISNALLGAAGALVMAGSCPCSSHCDGYDGSQQSAPGHHGDGHEPDFDGSIGFRQLDRRFVSGHALYPESDKILLATYIFQLAPSISSHLS